MFFIYNNKNFWCHLDDFQHWLQQKQKNAYLILLFDFIGKYFFDRLKNPLS